MEVTYEAIITICYTTPENEKFMIPERDHARQVRLLRKTVVPPGIAIPGLRCAGGDLDVQRTAYCPESRTVFAIIADERVGIDRAADLLREWVRSGFHVTGTPTSDYHPLDRIFREVLW